MKKILFIHIPKNCGNSIKRCLVEEEDVQLHPYSNKHYTLSTVVKKSGDISDYFSFTVIRNPYDRLVSYYHFQMSYTKKFLDLKKQIENDKNTKIGNVEDDVIAKYINNLPTLERSKKFNEYLGAGNLKSLVSRIKTGHQSDLYIYQMYKNLGFKGWVKEIVSPKQTVNNKYIGFDRSFLRKPQWDYLSLGDQVGMNCVMRHETISDDYEKFRQQMGFKQKLAVYNSSSHKHYRDYYDQELIDLVTPFFKCDLEKFGYEF